MTPVQRLRSWWGVLGLPEKALILLLVVYLTTRSLLPSGISLLLALALPVLLVWVACRNLRGSMRQLLWRLRNRLLVSYLFIAVVPVVLIAVLAGIFAWIVSGQIATFLVNSELDRRINNLRGSAQALVRSPVPDRRRILQRVGPMLQQRLGGVEILVWDDGAELRFPELNKLEAPPAGWHEVSGIVAKDGLLYCWAHTRYGERRATIVAPLTRAFLLDLAPGLGVVTLVHFPEQAQEHRPRRSLRLHEFVPAEDPEGPMHVPPPVNRLDVEVVWGTPVEVGVWDNPGIRERALLGVHSRISTVLGMVFRQRAEGGLVTYLLYFVIGLFLTVELISLVVGVSLTRTITGAVHDLYEGTERVRRGDFAHRIEVQGDDQIAAVSHSFNRMAENLEQLLAVAKEKERLQTEIEIAREVQTQLYPKRVPELPSLQLGAMCSPARMVSGDYYDYLGLYRTGAVLAIGDVAGKGISAALLMATLQSSLRTQVRASLEMAAENQRFDVLSTSRLVTRLNQQLFTDTSPEKYATFFFSVYSEATGQMTYTNAGHLPPLLLRQGSVSRLDVNGTVVGAFPSAEYGDSRLDLLPGDLLVCYTDGVTEPENIYGEPFGEERLLNTLLRNAHRDLNGIIASVMESVVDWTGSTELQDDMTLLLAKRVAAAAD